jgi:hypothetical protein
MRSREIEEEKSQNGCGEEAEKAKKKKKEDNPSDVTESVVILGSYIFFFIMYFTARFRKTFIPTRHAVK